MRIAKGHPAARHLIAAAVAATLTLTGCASSPGGASGGGVASWIPAGVGCAIGGGIGWVAGKALAERDRSRLKLSAAEYEKRERGYAIAAALVLCPVGGAIANTVYGKLSEAGRKDRERALQEAARTGQVQRYSDPSNPRVAGVVTPTAPAVEGAEECVTNTDDITDGASKDSIPVKFCRRLGSTDPYTVKTA